MIIFSFFRMIQLDDSGLQSTQDQTSIQQEPLLHAKHSKNLPEKSERNLEEEEEKEEDDENIIAGTSSPIIYEDPFIDNNGMENSSDSSVEQCNTSTSTSSSDSSDSEPIRMKQTKKIEKTKKQKKQNGVTAKEKKKELKKKQLRTKLQTQRVVLKKAAKELQTTLRHLEKLHK